MSKTGVVTGSYEEPWPDTVRHMRSEVRDFMKMCERLISLAMQTGNLSTDECEAISYYSQELHDVTHPLCTQREKCDSVSSN